MKTLYFKMYCKFLIVTILAAGFSACITPRVAVNPRADFSSVKRVAVMPFNGLKGELAADLLAQSLLAKGADVVERQRINEVLKEQAFSASTYNNPAAAKQLGAILGVDALFFGTVAESREPGSYLVTPAEHSYKTDITPVANGNVHSDGTAPGTTNTQIMTTAASASLTSRMVDTQSGSLMWSASMTYEGFDLTSAMAGITDAFVSSMSPIWPALTR